MSMWMHFPCPSSAHRPVPVSHLLTCTFTFSPGQRPASHICRLSQDVTLQPRAAVTFVSRSSRLPSSGRTQRRHSGHRPPLFATAAAIHLPIVALPVGGGYCGKGHFVAAQQQDDGSCMIEIDGAHGEGGGAILRQALGMSAYAGVPVRVVNIRAGRSRPGLAPQHLTAVKALAAVCGARVGGLGLSSTEIVFEPGEVKPGVFAFDIGTAGSITLLLQTLLLPCLSHPGEYEFRLTGGTDVPWSPPADYMKNVTLEALTPFGVGELNMHRRGYYPKGGGRILARLESRTLPAEEALDFMQPGEVKGIHGISHAASPLQERHVAERQADAADHLLSRLGCPVNIAVEYSNSACLGSGVTLWTESEKGARLGGAALGARDKPADVVGREAAKSLMSAMSAGVATDRYLADQLIPFLAVRGGSLFTSEISSHLRSNIYVAERIIGTRFEVMGTIVSARPVD